jgi:hypothetical protein
LIDYQVLEAKAKANELIDYQVLNAKANKLIDYKVLEAKGDRLVRLSSAGS